MTQRRDGVFLRQDARLLVELQSGIDYLLLLVSLHRRAMRSCHCNQEKKLHTRSSRGEIEQTMHYPTSNAEPTKGHR
jgi:hypothetical protein